MITRCEVGQLIMVPRPEGLPRIVLYGYVPLFWLELLVAPGPALRATQWTYDPARLASVRAELGGLDACVLRKGREFAWLEPAEAGVWSEPILVPADEDLDDEVLVVRWLAGGRVVSERPIHVPRGRHLDVSREP